MAKKDFKDYKWGYNQKFNGSINEISTEIPKAASGSVLSKKLFLKVSQYSQENT